MKTSVRLKAAALAATAIGLLGGTGTALAQNFGSAEIDQNDVVVIAAPGSRFIPYELYVYEQVTDARQCWSESGSNPVAIAPLLLTFDFTGICNRAADSNGYSVRLAGSDLGSSFRLQVVESGGQLVLRGVSNANGRFTIGQASGVSGTGFTKLVLNPGWRLTKRTFEGRTLGHYYFTNEMTLAQILAAEGEVATPPPTPTPPTAPITPTFPDVRGDLYATQIQRATEIGFISGFQDGTFGPRQPVTREQAVSMLVEALKIQLPNVDLAVPTQVAAAPFPDVAANRWSAAKIQFAKDSGIVSGDVVGTFRPSTTVSRVELMAMIRRAAEFRRRQLNLSPELPLNQQPFGFSDINAHWGESLISLMSAHCGIASPLNETGTAFSPSSPALRNYASAAIVRLIECEGNQAP
ncbi:MAG: DUF3747 domain-containing protein [Leptolyngbyaceae cyanobacterium RM1_1_2]|nr:DUF3747 domain-containing protein [Leptolyngbyaceae cyanobacterium RM1_1_2]